MVTESDLQIALSCYQMDGLVTSKDIISIDCRPFFKELLGKMEQSGCKHVIGTTIQASWDWVNVLYDSERYTHEEVTHYIKLMFAADS